MSVLIKNMALPRNCAECRLCDTCECLRDFRTYEEVLDAVEDGDLTRDQNCPLVEIPVPHGNLIDADEVTRWMQRSSENPYLMWSEAKVYRNIIIEIKNARTFVEAEGKL